MKAQSEFLFCPRCKSSNLGAEVLTVDSFSEASRVVTCSDCNHKWVEVFVFSMALDYESECPLDENGLEID